LRELLVNLYEPLEGSVPGLLYVVRESARRELLVGEVIAETLTAVASSGAAFATAVAVFKILCFL
jgi:hypothetical protein